MVIIQRSLDSIMPLKVEFHPLWLFYHRSLLSIYRYLRFFKAFICEFFLALKNRIFVDFMNGRVDRTLIGIRFSKATH